MREHLDIHIKPLMDQHPGLGAVLETAGIGCTTCSLGTCRVRDILEIHDLGPEATRDLLTAMGRVIHGEAPFEVPDLPRRAPAARSAFCPPIRRMVEEHTYILRVIACFPALLKALAADFDAARPLADRVLDFVRTYADRYHHAKEEDHLFGLVEADADILKVMLQDHVDGRAHVRAVAEALDARDLATAGARLQAYGELLTGHIQREDTILYPWINRRLTDRQVGELFAACMKEDQAFGEAPSRMEAFVADLETALA